MLSDELERLQQLRQSGALTEDEFQQAKRQVLQAGAAPQPAASPQFFTATDAGTNPFSNPAPGVSAEPMVCGMKVQTWNALMHVSQLLTWTVLGIAVPIVMWVISKDESREANRHGLVILNWMLSTLIYGAISLILTTVLIGVPMLMVLGVIHIIFPIIAGIHAGNGRLWKYPLSINFFSPDSV